MKIYVTKNGDCLASIAKQHGLHDAEFIYQDPANSELKKMRSNLHLLRSGDKVCIPDKKIKTVEIPTETCSVFTIKGLLTELKLVIEDVDGNPLINTEYQLDVAGLKYHGKSDDSGLVVQNIDASAIKAELTMFLDEHQKDTLFWSLELGALPPYAEPSGIQARLNNLGYHCANELGDIDNTTNNAINAFKTKHGLANDAVIDHALTSTLLSVYGI